MSGESSQSEGEGRVRDYDEGAGEEMVESSSSEPDVEITGSDEETASPEPVSIRYPHQVESEEVGPSSIRPRGIPLYGPLSRLGPYSSSISTFRAGGYPSTATAEELIQWKAEF